MNRLSLIVFLIFTLLLSGCGASETPEKTVTSALMALKNLDKENMQKYFTPNDLFSSSEAEKKAFNNDEVAKYAVEQLDFKILSSSAEKNAATVKTEITNIDMGNILSEYVKQAMAISFSNAFSSNKLSDEEIKKQTDQIFLDLLKKEDNKKVTSAVDIKLTKSDTGWKINMDDPLRDAMLGGLVSASNELSKSFSGADSELSEIRDYITTDIWNKGFCDISHYIGDGKSSTGEAMDIDFTLQQLADSMSKKVGYDTYINSLAEDKYTKLKQIWGKLSAEIDRLYGQIKDKKPTPNDKSYNFDTGLFTQYSNAFYDEMDNLNKE